MSDTHPREADAGQRKDERSENASLKLRKQLVLLHQVGNELSAAGSFDELCRQAVVRGRQLLDCQRIGLWFRLADSMTVAGSFGVDEQGQIRDERAQALAVSGHSPMGRILTHQHPLLISDKCSLWNDKGKVAGEGTHVVAALWNGARVVGCLCLDNLLDQKPFLETDCDLIKMYASTLGHLAFRKRAEDDLKKSLREKDILLREVHHRVNNNLQVISSLLNLQAAHIRDPHDMELFRQSQNRVKSMAKVYETFCQAKDLTRVNIHDYITKFIRDLFYSYQIDPSAISLRLEGCHESLSLTQAIPCGLIMNELVTNALKHGFYYGAVEGSPRRGEIMLAVRRTDQRLSLTIAHNGTPFPREMDFHNPHSLGLQLVNALVTQLNGTLTLDRNGGTRFTVTFPDKTKTKDLNPGLSGGLPMTGNEITPA